MLLDICFEVLEIICEFSGSNVLAQTCQRLRERFQGRYVTLQSMTPDFWGKLEVLADTARVLLFSPPDVPLDRAAEADAAVGRAVAALRAASHLHTVSLHFPWARDRPDRCFDCCEILAALKATPHLRSLSLSRPGMAMTDGEAVALAGLKAAPRLEVLRLDLQRNHLTDNHLRTLSALREASALHTLALRLGGNAIHDRGAGALGTLGSLSTLKVLSVDLSSSALIGPHAAQFLKVLKDAPSVTTLSLDLSQCSISDATAWAVAGLRETPHMQTLALKLAELRHISDEGLGYLSALRDAPGLTSLTLDLRGTLVRSQGATAVAALRAAPNLHEVCISVPGLQSRLLLLLRWRERQLAQWVRLQWRARFSVLFDLPVVCVLLFVVLYTHVGISFPSPRARFVSCVCLGRYLGKFLWWYLS